jgi:hypothetical protein
MNERILDLARQVWPDPNTSHVNHEKFAELIIRECANVAMQADIDGCNIGNRAWQKINEHFGVE